MKFHSVHEAYPHIFIKQKDVKKAVDEIDRKIAFLLINIAKGNFKD